MYFRLWTRECKVYRTRLELNGSRVIMVLPALFSPRSCSQAVISALLGRDSAHAIKNVEKDKELSLSLSLPLLDFQVPLIALNLFSTPLFVLLSPFLLLFFFFLVLAFGSYIHELRKFHCCLYIYMQIYNYTEYNPQLFVYIDQRKDF